MEARKRKVAAATEKFQEMSIRNESVLEAAKVSEEKVRKGRLCLEKLENERNMYQVEVEALRPGAKELKEGM